MHCYFGPDAAHTQENLDFLTNSLHQQYGAHFCVILSQELTLLETNTVLFMADGSVKEGSTTSPFTGQDSGVRLPANCALVISWRTSQYYRGGHPRTYLPGIVQDRLEDARHWSAQTIADFGAAAYNFRAGVNNIQIPNGSPVTLGHLQVFANGGSTQNPKVYLDPPRFHVWTSQAVHPRVDSQRRRLGRELVG